MSIPTLLRERAETQGDVTAYTFMDGALDGTGYPESLTWSQVYRRVLVVAEELRRWGASGDRVAIVAPQGLDYIVAFLGALQAGMIAVPLSVPQFGIHDERVAAAIQDSAPVVLLTASSSVADVNKYAVSGGGRPDPVVVEVDLLDFDPTRALDATDFSRPGPAYLQYTSGSTRTPTGVVVSHGNVTANIGQVVQDFSFPHDAKIVSWLPFYHDMGLILGVCFPVVVGYSAVLMSPLAFLAKPARWIQLLAAHHNSFSAAPNFAFELAVRRTSDADLAGLDLGGVHAIFSGAERVHYATIKRFMDRFGPFGLRDAVVRPSYGLAEATVYVATPQPGGQLKTARFDLQQLSIGRAIQVAEAREGGTQLVSYGAPRACLVRVVDAETGKEQPEGEIGEIWVRGDNVALGYWRNPERTARAFGARIKDPAGGTPAGPWLRTGDLGVMSGGELYIMGRLKDMLIVDGRNHYPDDIEATVQEITGGRVAAIAVQGDTAESLVAIIELKRRGSEEEHVQRLDSVKHKVAQAIWTSHNLRVGDLVLVPSGAIPITTSGKIRRASCAEFYRDSEFRRWDSAV